MLVLFFHHSSDIWELNHKVVFDGPNKLILVNRDVTDIDVEQDIYSDWKEWLRLRDNAKYLQAMRAAGGDPIDAIESLGGQFFLLNGWRVRTWEGDHSLNVNQNLRVDVTDPDIIAKPNAFVPTIGDFEILINSTFSSITNVIEVSGSSGASSGSFTDTDRDSLTNVETIVTSMQLDVQNILSSSFVAAGVVSGGTSNEIQTNISAVNGKYDGMFIIVSDASGGESRLVEAYENTDGAFFVDPPLSFTPSTGDSIVVIGGYDPVTGRSG
jgi:hypothetical protein